MTVDNELMVVQANTLIQKACMNLTATQYCILSTLVSKIEYNDQPHKVYEVRIKELADIIGYNTNAGDNRNDFKNDIKKLDSLNFWLIDSKGNESRLRFFSDDFMLTNDGKLLYTWHKHIQPFLFQLKGQLFTKYQLKHIIELKKNKYACRLYTLLKGYMYGKDEKDIEFYTDDLRELLMTPKQYTYNNFDQFVLKKAIQPFMNHVEEDGTITPNKTDLLIDSITKVRQGRKVIKIIFHVDDIGRY